MTNRINGLGGNDTSSNENRLSMKGNSMTHSQIGMALIGLVVLQGLVALVPSYGINGEYFKNAKSQYEGLRNLNKDKPKTAKNLIGIFPSNTFCVETETG